METESEHSTGSFPTMGISAATLKKTGKPERGRLRPRGVAGQGDSSAFEGHKSNRRTSYKGKMGATLHPTATLYAANAACATEGQKHVHIIPSKSSMKDDFRAKSTYGRTLV